MDASYDRSKRCYVAAARDGRGIFTTTRPPLVWSTAFRTVALRSVLRSASRGETRTEAPGV